MREDGDAPAEDEAKTLAREASATEFKVSDRVLTTSMLKKALLDGKQGAVKHGLETECWRGVARWTFRLDSTGRPPLLEDPSSIGFNGKQHCVTICAQKKNNVSRASVSQTPKF